MSEFKMFNKEEYNEWFEKNRIYNQLVKFFEQQENWDAMKDCYIICGRSEDFRALLRKALKINEVIDNDNKRNVRTQS